MLTGGAALVLVGLAPLVNRSIRPESTSPASSPLFLLVVSAQLLLVLVVLWMWRAHRPSGWPARISWGCTLILTVASIPAVWFSLDWWVGSAGLGKQPRWGSGVLGGLAVVMLLSLVPVRDRDRPVVVRCGLVAMLTATARLLTDLICQLPDASWLWWVTATAGLMLLAVGLWPGRGERRARRPDRGVPGVVVGALLGWLLVAAGAAMGVAAFVRWHVCLGWNWAGGELSCRAVRSHPFDYIGEVPGAAADPRSGWPELFYGVGLLPLAVVAVVIAGVTLNRSSSASEVGRSWGNAVMWLVGAAGLAATGLVTVLDGGPWPGFLWAMVGEPIVFGILALSAWRACLGGGLDDRSSRRWNLALVQLLLGLLWTQPFLEVLVLSMIESSDETPLFTGFPRALVLVVVGTGLLTLSSRGGRDLRRAPREPPVSLTR
jgi:hypothetical protein